MTEWEAPPEGYDILMVAEKYGVLPDDVESRMSEWWFRRALTLMEAETIRDKRRLDK